MLLVLSYQIQSREPPESMVLIQFENNNFQGRMLLDHLRIFVPPFGNEWICPWKVCRSLPNFPLIVTFVVFLLIPIIHHLRKMIIH